ncbi:MAG TPA: choline transporter, partial [Cryomorphaceae bacterium]|nr:choline transporter [Cryomorphaceae bacterium]
MSEPLRSDKKTLFGAAINPPVFLGSLAILLIGITTTVIVGEPMEEWFAAVQIQISNATGWFFILLVNLVLFFLIFVASSRFGKIRLGGKGAKT